MSEEKKPVIIKKYANRRLYHTGMSTYVTLDDLALMVQSGEQFQVRDAKTNEDITRSVLTQIIVEQENKGGQHLLPVSFLRDIISFYGDSMQSLVPGFLEKSFSSFVNQTEQWRSMMGEPFNRTIGQPFEDQMQRNVDAFQRAMSIFNPFGQNQNRESDGEEKDESDTSTSETDLKELKAQMEEMQNKINKLSKP